MNELIAIEVETIRSGRPSRASDVALDCRDASVSIVVSLRDGSATLSGKVDPRATAEAARTRLLALTITELLAQLWSREPAPSAPKTAAQPSSQDRPAAEDRPAPVASQRAEREILAYGAFAFRSMLEPRAALFGGALGLEYQALPAFALSLDVEAVHGSVRSEHALVSALLGSAALHAAIGQRFGQLALGVGPGVRLGVVQLSPTELEPNTLGSEVSGLWAGPLLLARGRFARGPLALYASFEAGVVTLPVVGTVDGQAAEVELSGAWLGASAGLGILF